MSGRWKIYLQELRIKTELILQEPQLMSRESCMSVVCSDNVCITDRDLLAAVTRDADTWEPVNYTMFWGKTLDLGVTGLLGAAWPSPPVSGKKKKTITYFMILTPYYMQGHQTLYYDLHLHLIKYCIMLTT